MQNSQLPYWLIGTQIVVTTVVAVITLIATIWIQTNLGRVAKNKLKLDLFDRRFEILPLIREIANFSLGNDEKYFEKISAAYQKFLQIKLLFPKKIETQIDEFMSLCDDAWTSNSRVKETSPDTSEGKKERDEFVAIRKSIRAKVGQLIGSIEEFIRIDWEG
jgi:hypothetical protein